MKICISGSSGLIGAGLIAHFTHKGHSIHRLVRSEPKTPAEFLWNPSQRSIDMAALEGVDAVIHLAGENIASGYWTKARKQRIKQSRVDGTETLARAVLDAKVPVFISASAVGYYGSRGSELLDEQSKSGSGFLADVVTDWENAAMLASDPAIRICLPRLGIVLSKKGGALAKMLLPFRIALGGRIGNGQQYMSWIGLTDAVRAFELLLEYPSVSGPVNLVSPNSVTNAEFTKELARAVRRPAFLPVPELAVRTIFGEMGVELLLSSTRAKPTVLMNNGFEFSHSDLPTALYAALA